MKYWHYPQIPNVGWCSVTAEVLSQLWKHCLAKGKLKPAAQTCSAAAVGEHVALALSVMEILSILKLKPAAQTCSAVAVGEHVALALSVMEILSILKLKPAAQTCSAAAVGEHVALALSVMEILGNPK